jgi:hypothetical protein
MQAIRSKLNEGEPTPQVTETDLRCAVDSAHAASILGVARKTLANWRCLGRGPRYVKYGGRLGPVRYRVADLVAWQGAQLRTPGFGGGPHA